MTLSHTFLSADDRALSERFLADGWVIVPASDRSALEAIRSETARLTAGILGESLPADIDAFLDGFGDRIAPCRLNGVRVAILDGMAQTAWLREAYWRAVRGAVEALVGNELAMQRRINLSIQLPGDDSSLLPIHSDVWSGDSPFEVVAWMPLVDCYRTKSMFIVPRPADARFREQVGTCTSAEDLYRAAAADAVWLDVPYGQLVVFTPTVMHGNRINREKTTRWSMNCRFKSVLSPYADKKVGEFFEPITLRAASRVGMTYRWPEIGNE